MLRWLILLGAFALWAGCMALVYVNFKPAPRGDMDAQTRIALDHLFEPENPPLKAWKIYADPADLNEVKEMLGVSDSNGPLKTTKLQWNGYDERGLVLAGRLESKIKNRRETSLDEETRLLLEFPGTPFKCRFDSAAHISPDKGLEHCKFALKLSYEAFEIEALSTGNRDGENFLLNTLLLQNGQKIYDNKRRENVGGKTAPNAEIAPFLYKPDIDLGRKWVAQTIDFNMALKGGKDFMTPLPVKCVARRRILMEGVEVSVYEVRSDNGEARAWYSADGEVLKQTYKLAGLFDVVVVKEDDYSKH